jgi:phosphoribosylaminoimidazole-succinocarboxamide synthase
MISESHLISFELCTVEDIKIISRICLKVNAILKSYFERRNSTLAEVSCYFGKIEDKIYLIDDFTPYGLKVIPLDKNHHSIDPYNLHSAPSIKHYTDYLYNHLIAHK